MEIIKTVKRVVLSVLVLLIAAAAVITVANWDAIRLVYKVRTSDPERLAQEAEERRAQQVAFLREKELEVQLPDREQMEDLLSGKTTAQEVLQSLGLEETPEASPPPAESQQPEPPPPAETADQTPGAAAETPLPETAPTPTPAPAPTPSAAPTEQEILDKCVKKLYSYEVELMEELGQLKAQALAEYNALPAKERTKQALVSIGMKGLKQCYALEVVADERVQIMLSECRRELAAAGKSVSSADVLWTFYVQEKDAMKTKYLEKYL